MKFPNRLALLAAVAIAFLAGCAGCSDRGPDHGLPALEDLNVLLIVIDTLGAGHVGALNPGLDTTPNLDRLARGGVLFTRAASPSPWTQPTFASLMTGLTPSHHGVRNLYDSLGDEPPTLAEMMAARGFRTAGVVSHFLIARKLGFGRGFEVYDESAVVDHHRGISSPRVALVAQQELERLQDERFFLFVHLFDPHAHYLHHEDFDRTSGYQGPARGWDLKITELRRRLGEIQEPEAAFLRDLYREEIAFTDHYVGMILRRLDELGLRENTLVIVTADHGEEFMEHGWVGHTRFLYDTLIHVPLIVSLPGVLAPARVEAPVSVLDLAPTLMDLSGRREKGVNWDGESLAPLLAGRAPRPERALFAEVSFPGTEPTAAHPAAQAGAFLTSVTQGPWKLIHDLGAGSWSLYDRSADPGELNDRSAQQQAEADRLQALLESWEKGKVEKWRSAEQTPQIDEATRKRLRSLGYTR